MNNGHTHISLVAIPDAVISTLGGIYDVLNSFEAVAAVDDAVPQKSPLSIEVIGTGDSPVMLASGLPLPVHRSVDGLDSSDIVIVPSVIVRGPRWETGRYPELVEWIQAMYEGGAVLCSACSGAFLLAETGQLDDVEVTVHWAYADQFRRTFPRVPIAPERALIVSGERQQFISSGASTSWHDLVLYLLARLVGPVVAQAIARFYALQWHVQGLSPYITFMPPRDHGDAAILQAQDWLESHYPVANPVEQLARRSGLALRTFKRRFAAATGQSPLRYVQLLRVENAKRRLERSDTSIDEIAWQVGYEDPAFFRRLFKRLTRMTPGAYRRKFSLRDLAE